MKKTCVFIDSNIWFSAFYKKGTCSTILRELTNSSWEMVISEQVLEEVIRNIKEKIPAALPVVIAYFDSIKPTVVKNPSNHARNRYAGLAEPHDVAILAAAVDYGCQYFLTGNTKDFKEKHIKEEVDLQIIVPSQFILLIKSSS